RPGMSVAPPASTTVAPSRGRLSFRRATALIRLPWTRTSPGTSCSLAPSKMLTFVNSVFDISFLPMHRLALASPADGRLERLFFPRRSAGGPPLPTPPPADEAAVSGPSSCLAETTAVSPSLAPPRGLTNTFGRPPPAQRRRPAPDG